MPGTVTETKEKQGPIGVVTLTITGDASGGSVPDTDLATKIGGRLLALETNPGSPAPTTLYDITIDDADGHDVLEGVGANRAAAATEKVAVVYSGTEIHPSVAKSDTLTLKVANQAVNDAVIVVKLYYDGASDP